MVSADRRTSRASHARVAFLALVVALALPRVVAAQPTSGDTPWSKGVTDEQKATAQQLLEAGNQLFLQAKYREALAKYQQAVKSWNHPAIRFNIVRALIQLDKPVEAYANLQEALKYGAAPLEETVYQEALSYKHLLEGQIADVEISCKEPGATVTVDGNAFLQCPGKKPVRMAPGSHSVVGKKKDFLTRTIDVVLLPGKKKTIQVDMISLADATVTERRWKSWKPWAVVGGGAALGGLGVLLRLKAQSDMDQYGQEIANLCGTTDGCTQADLPSSTRGLESRARLENGIAIGTVIAGGAAIITGITLAILNRPRPVIPEQPPAPRGPQVVPAVSANEIGVRLIQQF